MDTRAVPNEQPLAATSIKLIIGAFLTLLGLLLTLDNLDIVDGGAYLKWWPIVLVAIGVIKLASGGNRIVGVILTVVGGWLTAYTLGLIDFSIFDLWPLLLIGGGLALVARAVGFAPAQGSMSAGNWGILNVRKIVETTRDYRGNRYFAFMGGFEIDLTGAEIAQSPAIIEVTAMWAGIEIYVPYHWEVVGEVVPIMGGLEVNVRPTGKTEKKLIVRGTAIMAGVEVKHAPGRTA